MELLLKHILYLVLQLLFAGNLVGITQTMPLAMYAAMESDIRVAISLSIVLICFALVILFCLRLLLHNGKNIL